MLDWLGCALFAAGLAWSRIPRRTLAAVDLTQGLPLGHGRAAAGAAHHRAEFELDDVQRQGVLQVGAVTLPTLFTAVEATAGSFLGRDLLRAAVAGYVVGPGSVLDLTRRTVGSFGDTTDPQE